MKDKKVISNILKLVEYIDSHIYEELTLQQLSNVSFISKYHLTRIFKEITGMSLMEYAKARKLTKSLDDLLFSDMKISEIAEKYGFAYEQSYNRLFKKIFGVTPLRCKRDAIPITITEKITINHIYNLENKQLYEPQIMIKPSFEIVGIKEKLFSNISQSKLVSVNNDLNYFSYNNMFQQITPYTHVNLTKYNLEKSKYVEYMSGYQVKHNKNVDKYKSVEQVPTMKYAVFTYKGNHPISSMCHDFLNRIYNFIYEDWINRSRYRLHTNKPFHFEEFTFDPSKDQCIIRIFIPVVDQYLLSLTKHELICL